MYNIVFNGDDKYIKYISVAITSIVMNTDKSKTIKDFQASINKQVHGESFISSEDLTNSEEGYHFHILSDFLAESTKEKLAELAKELNNIYPVEISTYILSDKEFRYFPTWHKSYLVYYRLKIPEILSPDIKKVFYIDGDTLLLSDVRELFAVDMTNDEILAVTHNPNATREFELLSASSACPYTTEELGIAKPTGNLITKGRYFNNGVFMMNIDTWKESKISEKSIYYLHTYHLPIIEQDALNICLRNYTELPITWNLDVGNSLGMYDKVMAKSPYSYKDEESLELLKNSEHIKLIHYASYKKPWISIGLFMFNNRPDMRYSALIKLWWEMVENVPAFKDELLAIKHSKDYIKATTKEQKLLNLAKSPLLFSIYNGISNLNKKLQPAIRKIEKPIKQLRNKIRGKRAQK